MKKITLPEIKDNLGERLAEDVIFKGFVLVRKGEIITEDLANRLSDINGDAQEIWLDDFKEPRTIQLSEDLISGLCNKVQMVMKNYSFDNLEDANVVTEIIESIISGLLQNNCYLDMDLDQFMLKSPTQASHILNTTIIASLLAIKSGKFQRWLVQQIALGALLHDIGYNRIFSTPDVKLEDVPHSDLEKHPIIGYEMVKDNIYIADSVKKIILMHHVWESPEEGYDSIHMLNRSYPSNYAGMPFAKGAKSLSVSIVQVANAFERMSNPLGSIRRTKKEALQDILQNAERKYGEGAILLAKYISPYAVGEEVKLSNGRKGTIIKQTSSPLRPIVSFDGKAPIDLRKYPAIAILD